MDSQFSNILMKKNLVSIVIPCRNEIEYISNLINSIKNSNYPQSFIEILIVDGMSDDGTRDLLHNNFTSKYNNIKLLDNIKQKTPFAFNLGIKHSQGEFLIIIGARHVISKNYISEVVKALKYNNKIGCVGGIVNNVFENNISKIISLAMCSPFGVGFSNFRSIKVDSYVDSIGSPAFRKEIFDEIGYFDERLTRNQDDDFSFRVIKAGYKILLKANTSVNYNVRTSLKKLFRQFKQYGYWKVFVNKKHKSVTTIRQLFPMLFLISIIILLIIRFAFPLADTILIIELILYILLSLYFSIRSLKHEGLGLKILVHMYVCFILHVSYGLGYIEGILDFFILNRSPNINNEKLSR